MDNLRENTKNGPQQMKNISKSCKESHENGLPGVNEVGCNSPFFDDFDDELCMELEEVGMELDRYKAESSKVSDSRTRDSSVQVLRDSPLPSPQSPSPLAAEAPQPTSLCSVKTKKVEVQTVSEEPSPVMPAITMNHKASELNEESECKLKALTSLKTFLVNKLKVMVYQKTKLALEKDSFLKNFDGDKNKLSENLHKNLSQSKEVDVSIQSLNLQITVTRKKIAGLRNKKHLPQRKKDIKQSDNSIIHKEHIIQTHSKNLKDTSCKTNDMCEKSNDSLMEDVLKTSAEIQETVIFTEETTKDTPNDNQTNLRQDTAALTVSSNPPNSPSKTGNTTDSPPKATEACETKKRDCEVVERLASKLAMHPSTKNLNTLWCKTCNMFFTSILGYIRHLELPEHLDKEKEGEEFLYKLLGSSRKVHEEDKGSTQEAFGLEFLRSTRVMYCSLCECPLITKEDATRHSQSLQHTKKYKEYILKNASSELAFQRAKMIAFTEYYKRRKAALNGKKQITEASDENPNKKAITNVDNNTQMESGVCSAEPMETKPSNEEKKARLQNENNSSCLQGKGKEGRKLSKECPLMPQKILVNVQSERSVVEGSIKQIFEHPAITKRQKLVHSQVTLTTSNLGKL